MKIINYKKTLTGSLMALLILSTPIASFAKENEKDDNGRGQEKSEQVRESKQEKSWFGSNWFNSKSSKKVTSAPVVSNLSITTKGKKATIKWNTDLRSNSMIWYSKTSSIDTTKAPTMKRNDRVLKHKFEINKLAPNTVYYVVVGGSTNGGVGKSVETTFTTGGISTNISIPVITSATGTATMKVGETASFTFNAYDPQNKALTYEVSFGDGNTVSPTAFNQTVTLSHVYNTIGTYVVKFTVTNSDGKKATYPMQIKVTPTVTVDTTAPEVKAFVIPATATTLAVNITTFTATDANGIAGYKITETATIPGASDAGWTSVKPTTYTFSTAGAKTLYAWAKDANGNVSTSLHDTVIITLADTTAPTISGTTTNVSATSATIAWTTNEASTSTVYYGTTAPIDTNAIATPKVTDAGMVTSHSLMIPGLTSNTIYHFIIKSVDASNNVVLSSDSTFTTTN